MASSMIDSILFRNVYSTPQLRACFDDYAFIQNELDIEAALATSQAELGIIPKEAAAEIVKKAKVENLDFSRIEEGIMKVGHSLVPTLREFERVCDNGYGEYIHYGATTQDIVDTAYIMAMKKGFELMFEDLKACELAAIELSERYADTVMAGRTHGQQALPITFGYKAAIWAAEIHRNIERCRFCYDNDFVGEMHGAVGTLAGFGEHAVEVSNRTIEKLGLKIPETSWHASRDRIGAIVSVLALCASTIAKIGKEMRMLQRTEYGEAAEGFKMGDIGSSTMPHKRNPNIAEGVQVLAKLALSQSQVTLESMLSEHERDGAAWKIEWKAANETVILAGTTVAKGRKLLENLTVFPERMKQNLTLTHGLMFSEPVMLALGEHIGKQTAHEVVYEICMKTVADNTEFLDELLADKRVTDYLSKEQLQALLDPEAYTGESAYFARKVAKDLREARETN